METEVLVAGVRGRVDRDALIHVIADATEDASAVVQAFDPAAVYGAEHLVAAARRAFRSHEQGRAIARDLAVEIACYAAGTTQIDDALAAVGIPPEGEAAVLVGVGPDREQAVSDVLEALELERDDALIQEDAQALDRLGIPPAAREAVGEDEIGLLVREHVALLDTRV